MKRNRREEESAGAATLGPNAPRTRRAFMKLMAAGSTALLVAGPARRAGAASSKKSAAKPAVKDTAAAAAGAKPGTHVALADEIEKQKKSTADSLKKLRAYSLPPGSPQGFAFRPLPAKRSSRRTH
jgi:hypothetical protein